jgi:Leucine-rich repeat (LRR) protein
MVYDPSTSVVRRAHLDDTMNMEVEDNVDRDGGVDGAVQEQQGSMPSPNSLMTMQPLMNLKILCLDRNNLTELPSLLGEWVPNLVELYVRHNNIQSVANVKSFPPSIKIIHLSSNQLKNLNGLFLTAASSASSVSPQMTLCELTHLYVNGNQLSEIPYGILRGRDVNGNDNKCCCPKLQRFIFSHNPPLKELPADLWDHIKKNQDGGGDKDDDKTKCEIVWEPNPNLVVPF